MFLRLIGRMLVRAPERRASLEELAADPWLTAGASISPGELEVPLVSRESLSEEDHTHILHKMVSGKIATKEEILE
jgi:SNF-related kinase